MPLAMAHEAASTMTDSKPKLPNGKENTKAAPMPTKGRMKLLARKSKLAKGSKKGRPYLDRLPAEIIARILDFLPRRDNLIHLRSTCRDLAAKTSAAFGKRYFTHSRWQLSRSGFRAFSDMGKNVELASYVMSLMFVSTGEDDEYDNYLLTCGFTGSSLARGIKCFPNLKDILFRAMKFVESPSFFASFAKHLQAPNLAHLTLMHCKMADKDLAKIITKHKSTLHYFCLVFVDLYGGGNEMVQDLIGDGYGDVADEYRTPWTTVFNAMLEVKSNCSIYMTGPMQLGEKVESFQGYDQEIFSPESITLSITDVIDEEVTMTDLVSNDIGHQIIRISSDDNWRESLRLLEQIYGYAIYDPERDDTPPWQSC